MSVADRLLLDVANRRRLGADVTRAVVGVRRGGSMEGFPSITVTLADPRVIESSVILRAARRAADGGPALALRPVDLLLDGVWYRLSQVSDPDDGTGVLTFDHRGQVYMDAPHSPIAASRGDTTRALFIRRQVDEVGRRRGAGHRLGFWAPEVRRRMPIAKSDAELDPKSEPDRDPDAVNEQAKAAKGLTVKGAKMDAEQRRNAARALGELAELNAPPKATLATVLANIGEALYRTRPVNPSSKAKGLYQLLPSTAEAFGLDPADVEGGTRQFALHGFTAGKRGNRGAIPLARAHAGLSAGTIASMVEGSDQGGAYYDQFRKEAEAIIDALGGASSESGLGGSYVKAFKFRRDKGESAWESTGRLAEEVRRRRFIMVPRRGSDLFVYSDDAHLLALPPQARFAPDGPSVTSFSHDLDHGKTVRTATASLLLAPGEDLAWGLPVVVTGDGAASGKWLVWDVSEEDGSPEVQVELRQPQPPRLEPASESVSRPGDDEGADAETASGKFVAKGKAIGEHNYPYVWGGGHAHAGRPDNGTGRDKGIGYDCSGYISACAKAAEMWPKEWGQEGHASGDFASSWGEPGEGEHLTIWANAGHVFAEVKRKGERVKWVDTSRQAGGPAGPHVRYGNRSTAGFTPRHWQGT